MAWSASLNLDYSLRQLSGGVKTVAHFSHTGPLRILQSLYPEGDEVCHNVLVHPPGGLVGGDTLNLAVGVAPGATCLLVAGGGTCATWNEPGIICAFLAAADFSGGAAAPSRYRLTRSHVQATASNQSSPRIWRPRAPTEIHHRAASIEP